MLTGPGERLDDLQRKGYRIIQDPSLFRFGTDAVLLAWFSRAREGERILDLGTGTGIVPLLMEARTGCGSYTGLEISGRCAGMAQRSVHLNGLDDRISIIEGDIQEADRIFPAASFDTVTCNPPYMAAGQGPLPKDPEVAAARYEIRCTLDDVCRAAAHCLRPGGCFFMVHRPWRLAQIMESLRDAGLEPKRMRFVHPRADRPPVLVLIESARGGKPRLEVEAPLILYGEDGQYTRETAEIYRQEE